jgi:dihydroorotate dehydrogenase electron transfer subunit
VVLFLAMIKQYLAEIVENKAVTANFFKLTVQMRGLVDEIKPAHFLSINIPGSNIPFLKKPFSIYNVDGQFVSIVYRVIGAGTKCLSALQPGQEVNVLAPLGKPLLVPSAGQKVALVAGGVGLASLHLLAKQFAGQFDLFYGVRSAAEQIEPEHWRQLARQVYLSSDDGSVGLHGVIGQVLADKLADYDVLYMCGPRIMLQKISELCQQKNVKHFVIMEEYMACGIGVCMGCVVNTKQGYLRVCKDGPVFAGEEIIW